MCGRIFPQHGSPEIYQIWTVNQAKQNAWLKETLKKGPIKALQLSWGCNSATLSLPESACVSIHMHCTFSLLINTLLVSLLSLFVKFFSAKPKGEGSCHWPLVWWLGSGVFSGLWPSPISGWEQRPTPSHCQLRPPEINMREKESLDFHTNHEKHQEDFRQSSGTYLSKKLTG